MDMAKLPKLDRFNQYTTVYIEPSELPKFWDAFTPAFQTTAAAPECLYFEVFEDPAVVGKIVWIVNWGRSVEWVMTEHISEPHYAPYLAATEPLFTQAREIAIKKRKDGYAVAKSANFAEGGMKDGFSLHLTVHIKPECIDAFWTEFDKVFKVVASEEECLYFELFEDPEVEGKISWVENWSKSLDWFFKEQFTKEYYKPYLAATEPMFAKEREFTVLHRRSDFVAYKEKNFAGARIGDYGVPH